MNMQFEVLTDLTPFRSAKIETNKEAIKAALAERVAPYKTLVVTPESKTNAKKDLADLRKIVSSIDEQRKAVKQAWMAPYTLYENDCKELTGEVNEAIDNINGQVKAIEAAEKEQKKADLQAYFADNSADVSGYISFDGIFDQRWTNATFSMDEAKNIIDSKLDDTRNDLDTLRGMESPYEAVMLSEYAKSRDLRKAMAEAKRLEAIQRAEEERKAKEAENILTEEKASEEAAAPYATVYVPHPTPAVPFSPIRPVEEEAPPVPKTYTLRFEVTGTMDELRALRSFFDRNEINWKKL